MKTASEGRRVVTVQFPPPADEQLQSPWGPVGGPPRVTWSGTESDPHCEIVGMDPVILTTPEVVALCCAPGGWEDRGVIGEVDQDGILTLTTPAGVWFYELFPALWSDADTRPFYLAVWPD